jgi:hypothetical protein
MTIHLSGMTGYSCDGTSARERPEYDERSNPCALRYVGCLIYVETIAPEGRERIERRISGYSV